MAPGATTIKIIIVGAGITSLTLACLLENAKIEYQIYEREKEFKPIGAAINLSCQVFSFLDQLEIYDDLEEVSKAFKKLNIHTLTPKGTIHYQGSFANKIDNEVELFGYENRLMTRPDLFEVLRRRIPVERIHMGKHVIRTEQVTGEEEDGEKGGVKIFCEDGTSYTGDLLVGADGAQSKVRSSLYQELLEKSLLPESDRMPFESEFECVVGTTEPLDPALYPTVDAEKTEFQVLLVDKQPITMWFMPVTNNRIAWLITEQISDAKMKSKKTPLAPKPETAMEKCLRLQNLKTPYGTTFQDIIEKTSKDSIGKAVLESKQFDTWYYGRTVLIGNACRKILPFGAQGTVQAMIDGLQLANLIYEMKDDSYQTIQQVLQEFYTSRVEPSKSAVDASYKAGLLLTKKGWATSLLRTALLNFTPAWLIRKKVEKLHYYRPMATFLPWSRLGRAPMIRQNYSERMVTDAIRNVMTYEEPEIDSDDDLIMDGHHVIINGSNYMAYIAKKRADREAAAKEKEAALAQQEAAEEALNDAPAAAAMVPVANDQVLTTV